MHYSPMYFTEEHEMFRQSVRTFIEREITPHVDEWEEAGIFPAHDLFKKMGDLGFLGLTYPEEYGGSNLDYCAHRHARLQRGAQVKEAGQPLQRHRRTGL